MVLRDYADDPAPKELAPDDPTILETDYGNIVAFEHINLEVPDLEVARLFYSEVLGLTPDPSTSAARRGGPHVTWYNIGRQQLHIIKGPVAQLLPPGGIIGLVLPDVEGIAVAAAQHRHLLGELHVRHLAPGVLRLSDPHGVIFHVHASPPHHPNATFTGFNCDRGIAYLHLPCFAGTAAAIAKFYAVALGAPVQIREPPSSSYLNMPSDLLPSLTDAALHHLPGDPAPLPPLPGSPRRARAAAHAHGAAHGGLAPPPPPHAPSCIIRQESASDLEQQHTPGSAGGSGQAGGVVPRQAAGPLAAERSTPREGLRHGRGGGGDGLLAPGGRVSAEVLLGVPGTKLIFYEEPRLGPWSEAGVAKLFSGWHICFYIAQMSTCYQRLRTVCFNAHPYSDKVYSYADALKHKQIRFQDVVVLADPFAPPLGMLPPAPAANAASANGGTAPAPLPLSNVHNGSSPAVLPVLTAAVAAAGDDEQGSALVLRAMRQVLPSLAVVPATAEADAAGGQGEEAGAHAPAPSQGQLLFRLSHEVRMLSHPLFLRPLFNRSGPAGAGTFM